MTVRVFDVLSFTLTVLGTYTVFLSLRQLLPYYVMQYVKAQLGQTEERLNEAETDNAIPSENVYRIRFVRLNGQFSQLRMASNQSARFLGQLRLASLFCLTYKLYALNSRIGALQRDIEIAIDQHQLTVIRSIAIALPTLVAIARETPVINITGPTSPPPAARGLTYPPTRMDISQMAIDQYQLIAVVSGQSTNMTTAALPASTAITATRTINVVESTPPPAARGLTNLPTPIETSQTAMDEHRLASAVSDQSATAATLPVPGAIATTPTINAAEPTLPPPAIHCPVASNQSSTAAALPAATATPTINVAEPTDLIPAALS